MSKKMLINALHEEEARVAIVDDGKLTELDIEIAGKEETRGNVYKGVVVRVEPGLQAAFIDIGLNKLAFLQMGELHPRWWRWRDDVPAEQQGRRPRIQEVLRRGQELVVQVEKGERDMKGAAVTSYLSLPGRYMVLMPGSDSSGVSRKVEVESERKKLKEKAAQLEIPEDVGYIIRTEAQGRTKTELNKDLQSLVKLHQEIMKKAEQVKAPALIYQESSVVIRTIRDYFSADIDEILVDSKEVYKDARAFLKRTMPKYEKVVKLHLEKRPIFSRYQIEEQIDLIYEKKVPLKSGGSIVIEPTEALVSIDVNSGKSTGERGVEETAFRTNQEAAEEVARQLRLRDLGGLIVIDFIDMRDKKHMNEVEKALKTALKADKARVTVGKISQFGILEMSRQRIRQTIVEAIHLPCPHCEGRGKIKSVEAMAISFLRKVHAAAAKGTVGEVRGGLPLEVAYYLLNRKKRELAGIEDDYDIQVTVKGKPSLLMNQIEIDLVKRERPAEAKGERYEPLTHVTAALLEESEEAEEEETAEETSAAAPEAEEGEKKRKRKRRRKKKGEEGEAAPAAEEAEEAAAGVEPEASEAAPETAAAEEHPKKKRKRKRRGKGGAAEAQATEAVAPEEDAAPEAPEAEVQEAAAPEEGRKKKRRRRRRGKGGAEGAVAEGVQPLEQAAASAEEAPEAAASEAPAEEHRKRKRKRKKGKGVAAEAAAPPAEAVTEAPSPAPEAAAPAAAEEARQKGRRKKPVAAAPAEAAPAAPSAAADSSAPEPKKRKAAPRRKEAAEASPAEAPAAAIPAAAPAAEQAPKRRAATAPKKGRVQEEGAAPELPAAAEAPSPKGVRKKKPAAEKPPEAAPAGAEPEVKKAPRKRAVRKKEEGGQ